ncbi:hypothetical protein BDR22DRAFT_939939 [Usnea florida]
MVSLLDLPLELVEQIISILAEQKPPSARFLHENPSESILRLGLCPLKELSQVCHLTRELCFPSLFSAVKVDLDCIGDFLKFSKRHWLSNYADSVLLYIDPPTFAEKIEHISDHYLWLPMIRVIDSVMPLVMTLVLPPSLFAHILPYQLHLENQWAFNIPYQVLQLQIPRDLAAFAHGKVQSRFPGDSLNVFRIRPWTRCIFNQGSSVKGYGSYEYFYKQAPSLLYPLRHSEFLRLSSDDLFDNITSFDYIAVFPIDHFDVFCSNITFMTNLKCLRVQFAPTSGNDILDNPSELGKSQPKDLWQELESCYNTIARKVRVLCDRGEMSIETFSSLDYVNPVLCELIDRTAGRKLRTWKSDPRGGHWTRKKKPDPAPG